jgi:hypothetical protein
MTPGDRGVVAGTFVVIGVLGFCLWHRQSAIRRGWVFPGDVDCLCPHPTPDGARRYARRNTLEYQPMEVGALEGDWEGSRSQPLTLFAWPDEAAERNEFLLAIPPLGRLILSHDRNGEVDWTEGSTADRPPFDWSLLAFAQQASRRPLVLRPLRFLEPAPCLWSLAHRRRGAAGGRGFGRNLSHPIRSSFIRYYWLHSSTTPPESRPGCRLGSGMRVCHYQK